MFSTIQFLHIPHTKSHLMFCLINPCYVKLQQEEMFIILLQQKRLNGAFSPVNELCLLIESDFCPFHSSAVGVGFYGNSETNDGVYQLTYSLYNANRTLGGINNLVREACQASI